MDRNKFDKSIDITELSEMLCNFKTSKEICKFLTEILTTKELIVLSKRWRILNMLAKGFTQRSIASALNVSLCKVTRGAKILKTKNSITNKCLGKEMQNEK